jgi:hypothetical protein
MSQNRELAAGMPDNDLPRTSRRAKRQAPSARPRTALFLTIIQSRRPLPLRSAARRVLRLQLGSFIFCFDISDRRQKAYCLNRVVAILKLHRPKSSLNPLLLQFSLWDMLFAKILTGLS